MKTKGLSMALLCVFAFSLSACSNSNDPKQLTQENETEDITNLALVFTPVNSDNTLDKDNIVRAEIVDPDGFKGPDPLESKGDINLKKGTEYELTFEIINKLAPADDQNTCDEIQEESVAHQFYFGFAQGVFANPKGTGNIGENVKDPASEVIYNDFDTNGHPLGLHTEWTTVNTAHADFTDFHVILKHKPGEKGDNDTTVIGENDIDVTFQLNVVD